MDAELELLSHWVLDEGRIITNTSLLRQTDLDVSQSQQLFRDFLSRNITREEVTATYFLLGELADADTDDGIQRKKSVICKQADLEETKKKFKSISTCTIYSVQAQPLNDFHVLFNVDWMDSGSYLSPTKQKTMVSNPTAIRNYQSWKNSHQNDEQLLLQANKKTALNDKIKNEAKQKENEKLSKKIGNLFAKSIQATSPEKSKRLPSNSPEKIPLKKKLVIEEISETLDENTKASPEKKSRRGNILISSDEELEDDKEEESLASTSSLAKKAKATRSSTAASKSISQNTWETNTNDIFCTGEDSDEEGNTWNVENVVEKQSEEGDDATKVKKNKTQNTLGRKSKKGKKTKLIGCDSDDEENEAASESNEQMEIDNEVPLPKSLFKNAATKEGGERRQEKVTETFVDEDGFEVTHTVTRWVEDVRDEARTGAPPKLDKSGSEKPAVTTPSGSAVLKASNSANKSTAKKKSAAPAAAQPKISSFFTRKAE